MNFITTLILTFGTTILLSCGQVQNKPNEITTSSVRANNMSDVERLLDRTLPFVENYLREHGMFFPLASAIQTNDSIAMVGAFDGDENPQPEKVIADLKKSLRTNKNGYKTIAIFYDVKVVDPHTKVKTDAVAVFVETKSENSAYIFYYPYSLTANKQFSFSNGTWKVAVAKEIFND